MADTWTLYRCPECGNAEMGETCIDGEDERAYCVRYDLPSHRDHKWPEMHPVEVVPSSWKDRAERAEAALEGCRATIRRIDEATIGALRRIGAFTGGVVESIEALGQRAERAEAALREIAANRHSFARPAGAIAREALQGIEVCVVCGVPKNEHPPPPGVWRPRHAFQP